MSLSGITVLLTCTGLAYSNNDGLIDVLSIEDVPFPMSTDYAAVLNVTHTQEISEFTVCYRFLITSYNDNGFTLIYSSKIDNLLMR